MPNYKPYKDFKQSEFYDVDLFDENWETSAENFVITSENLLTHDTDPEAHSSIKEELYKKADIGVPEKLMLPSLPSIEENTIGPYSKTLFNEVFVILSCTLIEPLADIRIEIAVLPVGYRPTTTIYTNCTLLSKTYGIEAGHLRITPDGKIIVQRSTISTNNTLVYIYGSYSFLDYML